MQLKMDQMSAWLSNFCSKIEKQSLDHDSHLQSRNLLDDRQRARMRQLDNNYGAKMTRICQGDLRVAVDLAAKGIVLKYTRMRESHMYHWTINRRLHSNNTRRKLSRKQVRLEDFCTRMPVCL
jgi:hypothetical protein